MRLQRKPDEWARLTNCTCGGLGGRSRPAVLFCWDFCCLIPAMSCAPRNSRLVRANCCHRCKEKPGASREELRQALLKFIGDFANWDLAANRSYLEVARGLIRLGHAATKFRAASRLRMRPNLAPASCAGHSARQGRPDSFSFLIRDRRPAKPLMLSR